MQDRFKFRFWSKRHNCFVDADLWECNNGDSFPVWADGNLLSIEGKGSVIIEQCTGLKDKNGRLIYEGDILRLCEATYPAIIYWDGVSWCAMVNGKRKSLDYEFNYRVCNVVGNIHENPELVEDLR